MGLRPPQIGRRNEKRAMGLTLDQNKVMTTTRCARSVRKREGTSPEIRPMVLRGRGTAWSRGRLSLGLESQGGSLLKSPSEQIKIRRTPPSRLRWRRSVALVTAKTRATTGTLKVSRERQIIAPPPGLGTVGPGPQHLCRSRPDTENRAAFLPTCRRVVCAT